MKMQDLVNQSGTPRTTVHFYQREGLLPPADKTAPNVSRYNTSHLEQLVLIANLRDRGLSIAQIKNVLKWSEDGADPQVAASLELAMAGGAASGTGYILRDLARDSDVPVNILDQLHKAGHFGSDKVSSVFDGFDREAAICLGSLLELGVDLARIEATAVNIDKIVSADMSDSFAKSATMEPAARARFFLSMTENMDKLTRYFVLRSRQRNAVHLTQEMARNPLTEPEETG